MLRNSTSTLSGPPSPQHSVNGSAASTVDAKKDAKKARKLANRSDKKARRRTAAEEAKTAKQKQAMPWETALEKLPYVISETRATGATARDTGDLNVPLARPTLSQRLFRRSPSPVPAKTYHLDNDAAAAVVEELIAKHGAWSITFSDPTYDLFLTPNKDGAISFKVVQGVFKKVAMAFGDPVCAPARRAAVMHQFEKYCARRGLKTAFVGVRKDTADIADAKGWASLHFGVEQVVDPTTNKVLEGTSGTRITSTVQSFVNRGSVLRMYNPADGAHTAPEKKQLQEQLQDVYDRFYKAKEEEQGAGAYSTKLKLFELPRVMTYLYTIDEQGNPNGVAALMQVGEDEERKSRYLLDPCVAAPGAPHGTTDFLTTEAMGYLRQQGATHMSLGLEPLREMQEIRRMKPFAAKMGTILNRAAFDVYGFSGKNTLHNKFHPDDTKRENLYLVFGSKNQVGQAECALAIWHATHVGAIPVAEHLLTLRQTRKACENLDDWLGRLVLEGNLSHLSSETSSRDEDTTDFQSTDQPSSFTSETP